MCKGKNGISSQDSESSEKLIKGLLFIEEAFDLKGDPNIDHPLGKVTKILLKTLVTSPDMGILIAKIFEMEK